MDQVALGRLEGRGKDIQRNAQLMAQMHNVAEVAYWRLHGEKGSKPKLISERVFLPRKAKSKPVDASVRKQRQKETDFFNRLAGF